MYSSNGISFGCCAASIGLNAFISRLICHKLITGLIPRSFLGTFRDIFNDISY
jgi:hypothetical protein